MFKNLPISIREIKATEAVLTRIYDGAYMGLKGDNLAVASGLLPVEFNRLKEFDQLARLAELKGRADNEQECSKILLDAARGGDAKAALSILQHTHGWAETRKHEVTGADAGPVELTISWLDND